MTRKNAPPGLGARGRAMWREMRQTFVFSVSEEGTLLELCRCLDELDRLEKTMSSEPVVVRGSRGQPVPHPLLGDIRAHRLVLAKLVKALNLPDESSSRGAGGVRRGRLSSPIQAVRNGA
jgi:hypothetical protein